MAEWKALLAENRKLTVKFGADVTAPFLHLGHAVNLWMMREMQERGHLVEFLVGDFTTLVGDPTGRDAARPARTAEDIAADAEAFLRQAGRILVTDDPAVFRVRRNSEWWSRMPLERFLGLLSGVTAGKLLSRDMFRERMAAGGEVRAHEMVYPVLQGQDSAELGSDLTIVGSDQLFNESMGRQFQQRAGQRPQVIVTTRITPGLDGVRKQSKSLDNFVGLEDSPRDAFGKVMSLPDALIPSWMEVYTTIPLARVREIAAALQAGRGSPMEAKRELASAVVARLHGPEAASAEERWFDETVRGRAFPSDAPTLRCPAGSRSALELLSLAQSLAGTSRSRSELRRLIEEGAVELDGLRVRSVDEPVALARGAVRRLRVGRRGFFRLMAEAEAFAAEGPGGPTGWGC